MTDLDPRLMDRAKLILQDAPISSEDKAAAWDIYHDSRTAEIFARKITAVSIPDEVKRALLAAKQKSLAPDSTTPIVDAAIESMYRVAQLPHHVRSTAERHPIVAKFLVDVNSKS